MASWFTQWYEQDMSWMCSLKAILTDSLTSKQPVCLANVIENASDKDFCSEDSAVSFMWKKLQLFWPCFCPSNRQQCSLLQGVAKTVVWSNTLCQNPSYGMMNLSKTVIEMSLLFLPFNVYAWTGWLFKALDELNTFIWLRWYLLALKCIFAL